MTFFKKTYIMIWTMLAIQNITITESNNNSIQKYIPTIHNAQHEVSEFSKIIASCIGAAILYGISQDQITYRFCPEYFDQGFHKKNSFSWPSYHKDKPLYQQLSDLDLRIGKKLLQENPNNPTLRATVWGIIASWPQGLLLGIPLALACRFGSWPQLSYTKILKPLAYSMLAIGSGSLLAGFLTNYSMTQEPTRDKYGNITAKFNIGIYKPTIEIPASNIQDVTDMKRFIVDGAAHTTAYTIAPMATLGLIYHILKMRYDLSQDISNN